MNTAVFINCTRSPFIDQILSGKKIYETRTRDTLHRLLGQRVHLAETGKGAPMIKGSAVITSIITVYTREQFEKYRRSACIEPGSQYDWTPDTKKKVLYELSDVRHCDPFPLPVQNLRHGRVYAEFF